MSHCRMNFLGLIDAVEAVVAIVLTFVVSVIISIGRSVTCSNFKELSDR